ncbi:PrsW family intramembrane metalloprotease [Aeoliella sp. ICT_H6.2]|uniref:PrsW family intramembrane metalloprotease n=1 Tax=Aeoliella straminimaris TaxID=2954799 RepID=A0A9X2FI82_9BACT|nr:PrsW family glutamic-type intramembrane protease [Aeoliella straminimaris]MCO6047614.1 PrsW family intramembrane metalloprotease [Aeoliella straminimaris]
MLSNDPSIENEPQFLADSFAVDQSEEKAKALIGREAARATDHDKVDHVVWDEPTLASDLAGEPDSSQLTYRRWLEKNITATSWPKSWLVTFAVAAAAGPFAVIGALFTQPEAGVVTSGGLVAVCILGPLTEEIMKIAIALWVVEKRPFWFKSIFQILLCALAGGILFGVIENLIYLNVYIPHAGPSLARWRWTVCVGLHMNCSFIAGVGLARIWDNAIRQRHPPIMGLGMPWFFIAVVGHGLYNFAVTMAEMFGWLKFDQV